MDSELRKWLNLLQSSNQFVLKDKPDGSAAVLSPRQVPARDGFYWVHGQTELKSGDIVESVFHVDTDSGGELAGVFWFIDESWYSSEDSSAWTLLGGREKIFPFNWSFSVPLEEDIHH